MISCKWGVERQQRQTESAAPWRGLKSGEWSEGAFRRGGTWGEEGDNNGKQWQSSKPLNVSDTEERRVNAISESGERQVRELRKIGRACLFKEDEERERNM